MRLRFLELDHAARRWLRTIFVLGLFLVFLTAALTSMDELGTSLGCGAILILIAYLLSEAGERWLSRRAGARQVTSPGSAINVSSVADRLRSVRANCWSIHASPGRPFHGSLLASAGVLIKKRRFFSHQKPLFEEDPDAE
jgi:hypothetical protein